MNKPLNIVITSGGTQVAIDGARLYDSHDPDHKPCEKNVLTNFSSGTTGMLIAQYSLETGHTIEYLCSKDAKQPYKAQLFKDPLKPEAKEEARWQAVAAKYRSIVPRLNTTVNSDFWQFRQSIHEAVANPKNQVVMMSMAGSDFAPKPSTEGKISSDTDELSLPLEALPKIISEIKEIRRDIFLVGYKFLVNKAPDELIDAAYRSLLRDKQDLVVANVAPEKMDLSTMKSYLITLEKGIIPVQNRADLPEKLLDAVTSRYSEQYYQTNVHKVQELPLPPEEIASFLEQTQHLANLALFPEYLEGRREEFGFTAKRTAAGTLITGRGSSKSQATVDDLALVTNLDEQTRTLDVTTTNKKASLNANVAHLLFEASPETQYIVHAHIPLDSAARSTAQTMPGTQEDWEGIKELAEVGEKVIYQPNHGVFVLLEQMEELIPLLQKNGIYRTKPEWYDLAYNRFLQSTKFIDHIEAAVPKNAKILDLAAGTGEVTRLLQGRGYTDIELADDSYQMLAVAQQKIGIDDEKLHTVRMQDIHIDEIYDAIVVRQAINYLPYNELVATCKRLYAALKPGGVFMFNSFTAEGMESNLLPQKRTVTDRYVVRTQEGNIIDGNTIHHGQRSEIFDTETGDYELVYDLNSFYKHSPEALKTALKDTGFKEVEVIVEGKGVVVKGSKVRRF